MGAEAMSLWILCALIGLALLVVGGAAIVAILRGPLRFWFAMGRKAKAERKREEP